MALLGRVPSLRLTDAGRSVFLLLLMHMIDDESWAAIIENMPSHCDDALVAVARRYTELWNRFLTGFEERAGR